MEPFPIRSGPFVWLWLAVVAVTFGSAALLRRAQGLPFFRPKFSDAEVQQTWGAGTSSVGLMGSFARWWTPVCCVFVATIAAGCCASMQKAAAINAAFEAENRANAEPSMRSAAEQRGATLLPYRAQDVQLMPLCRPDYEHSCVLETADSGRTYRIRDDRGMVRLAVPVGSHAGPTTRLARHGTKLLVLAPKVTPRKVISRTACECDRMPRIMMATGFVHIGFAFFVDEIPDVEVEEVLVPVLEDQVEWKCNAWLL